VTVGADAALLHGPEPADGLVRATRRAEPAHDRGVGDGGGAPAKCGGGGRAPREVAPMTAEHGEDGVVGDGVADGRLQPCFLTQVGVN